MVADSPNQAISLLNLQTVVLINSAFQLLRSIAVMSIFSE